MTKPQRSIFKIRNIPDRNVMTNELGLKLQDIQAFAAPGGIPEADAGLTNAEASMLFNAWISAEAGRESYYQSSMKHERRSNQWMNWHGGVQAQLTAMTRRVTAAAHALSVALGKTSGEELQYETLEALVVEVAAKLDNRCDDERVQEFSDLIAAQDLAVAEHRVAVHVGSPLLGRHTIECPVNGAQVTVKESIYSKPVDYITEDAEIAEGVFVQAIETSSGTLLWWNLSCGHRVQGKDYLMQFNVGERPKFVSNPDASR